MNEEIKNAKSKADFIRLAGIGPDIAQFVTEFIETPIISFHCLSKSAVKLKTR